MKKKPAKRKMAKKASKPMRGIPMMKPSMNSTSYGTAATKGMGRGLGY